MVDSSAILTDLDVCLSVVRRTQKFTKSRILMTQGKNVHGLALTFLEHWTRPNRRVLRTRCPFHTAGSSADWLTASAFAHKSCQAKKVSWLIRLSLSVFFFRWVLFEEQSVCRVPTFPFRRSLQVLVLSSSLLPAACYVASVDWAKRRKHLVH